MFLPSFFSVYIIAVVVGGTSIYCFLGIHRFHYSPLSYFLKINIYSEDGCCNYKLKASALRSCSKVTAQSRTQFLLLM